MVPILGAITGALGIANGIKGLFGGGGGNPEDVLADASQKMLDRSMKISLIQMEVQSAQEAIKALSETMTAGHDRNMDSFGKIGSSGR